MQTATVAERAQRTAVERWVARHGRVRRVLVEVIFRAGQRYLLALTPEEAAQVRATA